MRIQVLRGVPIERLQHLIDESEREGFRFLVRMRNEWASGEVRFDGPGEALFVAEASGEAVGVCGLTSDPYANDRSIGRVRKLYVRPAYRRQGVGRQLLRELLGVAGGRVRELRVRTRGEAACAFYESLGFREARAEETFSHVIALRDGPAARPLPASDPTNHAVDAGRGSAGDRTSSG